MRKKGLKTKENSPSSNIYIPFADENPNPIIRAGRSGELLYHNKASALLLNFWKTNSGSLLPQHIIDLIKRSFDTGNKIETEVDTGAIYYSVLFVPIQEHNFVNIYANDITNYVIASHKLQANETKYRLLVESANEFIYTSDPEGRFTFINEVGLKKIGYSEKEILGMSFLHLVKEDWRDFVKEFYKDQFQRKKISTYFEFPVISKNGQEWWVGQSVKTVMSGNLITGFQTYAQDITERKRAEAELEQQQALINSILDHLPINIFIKDKAGKFIFVNKHVLNETGFSPEEFIGRTSESLSPALIAARGHQTDEEAWKKGKSISEEIAIVDGKERHYIVGKIVLHFDLYDEPLLLGYTVDITKRKKVETDLLTAKRNAEESMKAKERFISIMSHEIRTPMNAVVGITHLLLQQAHDAQEQEYFNALKISSENLLKILNNVLDLSKIESGKIVFEEIDFDLEEVLKKVKELFLFRAAEKNVAIEIEIDSRIPETIKGDPSRLNQILVNLLSNSIKFTEEGLIKIKVKLLDQNKDRIHLLFSVIDTGIGISQDKISTIFESFTQANSAINRKYGGTGLGLTITKRLIELQNGNIGVESQLNKGSKFIFDLTFLSSEIKYESCDLDISNIRNLAGLKALVVEDNKMNQMVVTKFLEKENVAVYIADDGEKAIKLLRENTYDIVLMDLQMPGLDGFETSRLIRNELKNMSLPIIAFTASSSSNIEAKVLKAGMNDYIVKPFEPEDFYSKIARYTKRDYKNIYKPVATMSSKVKKINLDYLKDASADNKAFIEEMIAIFLKQTPAYLKDLEGLLVKQNWTDFRKVMHKLKPTVSMMGIKEGEAYVKEIESIVKGNPQTEELIKLLNNLANVCNEAFIELQEELNLLQKK
ncbi:MAG: PAS domain S-box protein [Cytophagaceae bacterium]|nr:PAS domain S-box protein [Cytophagaceae bacterium]